MSDPGAVLFHRVGGDGEPVLLLNGVAMTIPSWEHIAGPLEQRFSVTRCDFRGQLMNPGTPPPDLGGHADDVRSLLDHLSLESVHVVGTSFGGVIGTLVAARYPERVRSLVTIASAEGFDEGLATEVARWRQAVVDSLEGEDRGHLSDVLEPVVYSPAYIEAHDADRAVRRSQIASLPDEWFRGLIGLLDTAHSARLRDELAAIRSPVLVVAAELDNFVSVDRVRGFAEAIPGAAFEIIEGAGHAVVVEQPGRIVELCLEFLGNLD